MAATVTGSSTATLVVFGCTAETGILINSYSRSVSREKAEIMDNDGDVVAVSYYKPSATYSIAGTLNGSTFAAAAAPGVALTLQSTTSGNGVTAGRVLIDSVTVTQSNEAFAEISIEGTQYPDIT